MSRLTERHIGGTSNVDQEAEGFLELTAGNLDALNSYNSNNSSTQTHDGVLLAPPSPFLNESVVFVLNGEQGLAQDNQYPHNNEPRRSHYRGQNTGTQDALSAWMQDSDGPWSSESPTAHFRAGRLTGFRILDEKIQQLGLEAPEESKKTSKMMLPPAPPPSPVDDDLLNATQELPRMAPPA